MFEWLFSKKPRRLVKACPRSLKTSSRAVFKALSSGRFDNFQLIPCTIGTSEVPTMCIVAVHKRRQYMDFIPHFVAVTDNLLIKDENGIEATVH